MTTIDPNREKQLIVENHRAKQLLINAAQEISQLRSINQILSAKVEIIDIFAAALFGQPGVRQQGAAPDVVHAIQMFINPLQEGQVDGNEKRGT